MPNVCTSINIDVLLAITYTPLVDVEGFNFFCPELRSHYGEDCCSTTSIHYPFVLVIHRHLPLYHQVGGLMMTSSKRHFWSNDKFVRVLLFYFVKVSANETSFIYDDRLIAFF